MKKIIMGSIVAYSLINPASSKAMLDEFDYSQGRYTINSYEEIDYFKCGENGYLSSENKCISSPEISKEERLKRKQEAAEKIPYNSYKYVRYDFLVTEANDKEIYGKEENGNWLHKGGVYILKEEIHMLDNDIEEGDIITVIFDYKDQEEGIIAVEKKW